MNLIAVLDTSVLMAFGVVGRLDLIGACFSCVVVPRAVMVESCGIEISPGGRSLWTACEVENRFTATDLEPEVAELAARYRRHGRRINGGEAEVLAYAKREGCLALTDDLAARLLARTENIQVAGTLGVLSLCKRKRYIPRCRDLVESMVAANRHLGADLIESFLGKEGEM